MDKAAIDLIQSLSPEKRNEYLDSLIERVKTHQKKYDKTTSGYKVCFEKIEEFKALKV